MGKLRIFWARPVASIRRIVMGNVCAYEVTWVAWRRPRWRSLLLFPSSPDYGELPVGSREYDYVIVVAKEE